jgi:hypothetical protein
VLHSKGRTQIDGFREQSAEGNIWSDRRLENLEMRTFNLQSSPNIIKIN